MRFLNNPAQNMQMRQRQMTVDTIYPVGCCNFFDACTTDILSLYYRKRPGLARLDGFNPDRCLLSLG